MLGILIDQPVLFLQEPATVSDPAKTVRFESKSMSMRRTFVMMAKRQRIKSALCVRNGVENAEEGRTESQAVEWRTRVNNRKSSSEECESASNREDN